MRRKILSIITVLCLIFPCVFFVACKEKETLANKEPYTYSICLKNAKGLIDENTLEPEFDYKKSKNVNWSETTDGDYAISATKLFSSSGTFVVNLLEGYDYSNVELKINDENKQVKIASGDNENVASKASLSNRQLSFDYKNISSDTEIVIDFSNCDIAKISIDVSNLKSKGVKYFEVNDDFVTLKEAEDITFNTIDEDKFVVDYGTIFAFNHSDSLATRDDETGVSQKLDYASYGIRYFNSSDGNKIQYLTAKRDCACEVYSIKEDNANNGSLRVLSSGGIKFASSLDNLKAGVYEETETDDEVFYGESFEFTVFRGENAFLELDADADDFDYYLLDEINQEWTTTTALVQQTDEENLKTYLQITLDPSESAKYLARKPKNSGGLFVSSDYYLVAANKLETNTKIINADYILINRSNYDVFDPSFEDDVYYGFKKDKAVEISLPATVADNNTGYLQIIKTISVSVEGNITLNISEATTEIDLEENPRQILTSNAYSSEREDELFRFTFSYSNKDGYSDRDFSLSTSEITLYEGEKIYYSTDLVSWQELNNETLIGSTFESKLVYYYISSERTDSYLTIEFTNESGQEIIGTSGALRDCFGRELHGLVSVNGTQIDLSKVMYLEIEPGYYGELNQANIIREYDKTYHEIQIENYYSDNIMVSVNGYKNTENFKNITTINSLNLRYEGYGIGSEIYYYVNSSDNKYIVLKNSAGEIVSTSNVVYLNAKEYKLDGNFVFQLSLNPAYYQEGECFTIEVVSATHIIKAEEPERAEVFKDNLQTQPTNVIETGTTYFILCDSDVKSIQIVDKFGTVVLGELNFREETNPITSGAGAGKKLYSFTFGLDYEGKYSPDSIFTIKLK